MSALLIFQHATTITGSTGDLFGVLPVPGGKWRYQPTEWTVRLDFGEFQSIALRGPLVRKDGTHGVDHREGTYLDRTPSRWEGSVEDVPGLTDLVDAIVESGSINLYRSPTEVRVS